MNRSRFLVVMACVLGTCLTAQTGQTIPRMEATTLNGQKVVLPDSRYKAIVLVLGFSHKSADQAEAWEKRIVNEYSAKPEVANFEIPELEGVPGLVKPMILHGMRRDVPPEQQAHFAPIYQHADELKKLTGYKEPDEAYVLVAASDGRVVWQTHGAVTDANYAELKQAVTELIANRK